MNWSKLKLSLQEGTHITEMVETPLLDYLFNIFLMKTLGEGVQTGRNYYLKKWGESTFKFHSW